MNYRTISTVTSLLGVTSQHQVLIQHPRDENAIALLPNTSVQNFQKETRIITDSRLAFWNTHTAYSLCPLKKNLPVMFSELYRSIAAIIEIYAETHSVKFINVMSSFRESFFFKFQHSKYKNKLRLKKLN
jgi:hypothetical protein